MAIKVGPKINTDNLIFLVDSYEPTSYSGAGNTWADLVNEKDYDASLSGVTFANKVMGLDGTNDYISIPGALTSGVSSLTIMGWSKFTGASFPEDLTLVNKDDGGSNRIFNVNIERGKLQASLQGGFVTENVIPKSGWFHWAQVSDSSGVKLYLNGLFEASGTSTISSDYSQPIIFGKNYDNSQFFEGNTAVIAVYDRALASGEIYENYKSSKGRFTPPQLAPYDPAKFAIQIDTTLGNGDNTYILGWHGPGVYYIDWDDGTTEGPTTVVGNTYPLISHTYSSPGIYNIQVSGNSAHHYFNNNTSYAPKLKKVYSFGDDTTIGQIYIRNSTNLTEVPTTWSCSPNSFYEMFRGCSSFNQDISEFDMSTVTSMQFMFYDATNFNNGGSAGINNWDLTNVTNMRQAFYNCQKFNQPIDNWDIKGDIYYMLGSCHEFNQPLDGWDTSNVTNMQYLFNQCRAFDQNIGHFEMGHLTSSLDSMFSYCYVFNNGGSPSISGWDTSSNTSLYYTFFNCRKFNQPVGYWDTSNVTNMRNAFTSCYEFNNGNDPSISGWNTSSVTNMYQMFNGCYKFNQPIGDWDTSNVTNMYYMFGSCLEFNQPLDGWDTSNVTDIRYMFNNCRAFDQNVGHFDTSKVTSYFDSMFSNCYVFNNGGSPSISGWNTTGNTTLYWTFSSCRKFNQPVGYWDTSNVLDMRNTFASCYDFNNGEDPSISGWDTSNATNMYMMFHQCYNFNQPIGGWDTSSVTNMYYMFGSCYKFNQPLNNWDMTNVTNSLYMFYNCQAFDQNVGHLKLCSSTSSLDSMFTNCYVFNNGGSSSISGLDTSANTTLYYTFANCRDFNQPIGNWDTSNVTTMFNTFVNCYDFDQNLGNWNLASLNNSTALTSFMQNCNLSTGNYDALLNGWNSNKLASANGVANWRTDLSPHFGSSKYTTAASGARQALINYGWTITDGGLQT